MALTNLSHDNRALNPMKKLRVMDDMNDSRSSIEGSRSYEQLRVVVDMNDSKS